MGQIHLSEVQCLGPEKSLWNCPHKNITQQDCRHSEDAGIRCNVPYMAHETMVGWAGKRGWRRGDGASSASLFWPVSRTRPWGQPQSRSPSPHRVGQGFHGSQGPPSSLLVGASPEQPT